MHIQSPESHQFALFYANLSESIKNLRSDSFLITQDELVTRITKVLRLQKGEVITLFDQHLHAQLEITDSTKKNIQTTLLEKKANPIFRPPVHFLLPLLKKDAFESALYAMTEMGVQEIQLVLTEKSRKDWYPKDEQRAQKIIIAAAEQSKNFTFPHIHPPVSLTTALQQISSTSHKLFFDPQGIKASEYLESLTKSKDFTLLIGPEGDLTMAEKELVKKADFAFCALTPTILRACQAAALSAGIIRSYLNS